MLRGLSDPTKVRRVSDAYIRMKQRMDETEIDGLRGRIDAAVGLHLFVDVTHVKIDAVRRELEENGNRLVGFPFRDDRQNLFFPGSEINIGNRQIRILR